MKAIKNRCFRVRVTCDPIAGRTCGYALVLPEIDEYEAYDTKGFIPSERLTGPPKKPGVATLARPRARQQADDEQDNQNMHLPPMAVLDDKRDRNRVYWAVTEEGPVIKGMEEETDGDRLRAWDRALEALGRVEGAADLDELSLRAGQAEGLIVCLAQAEGWAEESNHLLDELHSAFRHRQEHLLRREENFTDADHRVEGEDSAEDAPARGKRRKGCRSYADENVMAARVHEIVRRMRSCRTEDDLLDVACWVGRHKEEFTGEALETLRKWFAYFRAELTAE
jgi:hypothetical protein